MQLYQLQEKLKKLFYIAQKCLPEKYQILQRRLAPKSIHTQELYLSVLNTLCEKGAFKSEEKFNEVVKEVIFSYSKLSTRRAYYFAIKFISQVLGYTLDLYREELKVSAEEPQKVSPFTIGEIGKLINTSLELLKNDNSVEIFSYEFYPQEFLKIILLTTLYGTRRGEIFLTRKEDISFEDNTIFIRSLKKSVQRRHLIPSELTDLFREAFKVNKNPPDARYYNDAFIYLLAEAGVQRVKRRNIHSIRKALVSQLLMRGVNPLFVNDFLRWKGGGTMLSYYANLEPLYIDTEIFKSHPFLEVWKKEVWKRNVEER